MASNRRARSAGSARRCTPGSRTSVTNVTPPIQWTMAATCRARASVISNTGLSSSSRDGTHERDRIACLDDMIFRDNLIIDGRTHGPVEDGVDAVLAGEQGSQAGDSEPVHRNINMRCSAKRRPDAPMKLYLHTYNSFYWHGLKRLKTGAAERRRSRDGAAEQSRPRRREQAPSLAA